jgi:hypothetical protein
LAKKLLSRLRLAMEHHAGDPRHRPPRHARRRADLRQPLRHWGRVRWGLLREYEVYEDTQASKALDDHVPALVAS